MTPEQQMAAAELAFGAVRALHTIAREASDLAERDLAQQQADHWQRIGNGHWVPAMQAMTAARRAARGAA